MFSVLTPTWNRASYLPRVYKALLAQTYSYFEWIVADDGSEDDTEIVVRDIACTAPFPITYIRADRHVGKALMDNESVRQAKGDFILWCDSDDWLLPNALQRLMETWNSIHLERRTDFVGMTALAAHEKGCIVNPFPDVNYKDVSWNDLSEIYKVTRDMLFCTRADILKAHAFPEVDFVIPESVVWSAIGDRKSRLISEVLKIIEYNADHCISFSGRMEYNRGRAYALAASVRNVQSYPQSWQIRTRRLITFIRYCVHGELNFSDALRLWGDNSNYVAFSLAIPLALLLATKDALQGKVVKSHREFLVAKGKVKIIVERINNY